MKHGRSKKRSTRRYTYDVMNVLQRANIETESAMLRCLHIQFRSKIRSRSRRAVLWERKSLMSNICLMPESQRIHLVRPVNRSIKAREAFRKVKDLTVKLSMVEKCGVPPCGKYQKDAEEGKCIAEYHDSDVYITCIYDHECFGRKRA